MSIDTLLPCPFCGSPAEIVQASNADGWWIIRCTDNADDAEMACRIVPELQEDNREMAICHWNHRVHHAGQSADLTDERLLEMREDYFVAFKTRSGIPVLQACNDATGITQRCGDTVAAIDELLCLRARLHHADGWESKVRNAKRNKTEIFSIFGQCEAVVANMMIEEGKLTRIAAADIPPTAAFNEFGNRAQFAVVVQPNYLAEFNRRCAELRA